MVGADDGWDKAQAKSVAASHVHTLQLYEARPVFLPHVLQTFPTSQVPGDRAEGAAKPWEPGDAAFALQPGGRATAGSIQPRGNGREAQRAVLHPAWPRASIPDPFPQSWVYLAHLPS